MGKKNDDVALPYYTYSFGSFEYVPGEPSYIVTGIKGKENIRHVETDCDYHEKKIYHGYGGYRCIPLAQLNLMVSYHKGEPFQHFSDDKGTFVVDVMYFVKHNLLHKNGDPIKKITAKLVDTLNMAVRGNAMTSYTPFQAGQLPPDLYLFLLRAITHMSDLKRANENYYVVGSATCVKLDPEAGKGEVLLYNNEVHTLPRSNMGHAKVGEKGELVYLDHPQNHPFQFLTDAMRSRMGQLS